MHLPAIARSPRSPIGCPLPSLADVVFSRVQEKLANASRSPQAEGLAGVQLLLIEDPLPLTLAQLEGTLHDSNRACSCQPCPVPGFPLGLVGRGRRSKAVRRHSCHCDPVRRSGRREGAGVSGARPEGGKDAAVGRGLGSGPLLSLGVLVHRAWLRPLLLQYATPPLPSASRRTPHKLQ
jgi:hypothetical protein